MEREWMGDVEGYWWYNYLDERGKKGASAGQGRGERVGHKRDDRLWGLRTGEMKAWRLVTKQGIQQNHKVKRRCVGYETHENLTGNSTVQYQAILLKIRNGLFCFFFPEKLEVGKDL